AACGISGRMARIDELPDDPTLLKRMVMDREDAIERIKSEAAEQLEAQQKRHQAELAAVLRRIYGPKNERFDPTQLLLFRQQVEETHLDEPSIAEESGQELTTRRI